MTNEEDIIIGANEPASPLDESLLDDLAAGHLEQISGSTRPEKQQPASTKETKDPERHDDELKDQLPDESPADAPADESKKLPLDEEPAMEIVTDWPEIVEAGQDQDEAVDELLEKVALLARDQNIEARDSVIEAVEELPIWTPPEDTLGKPAKEESAASVSKAPGERAEAPAFAIQSVVFLAGLAISALLYWLLTD